MVMAGRAATAADAYLTKVNYITSVPLVLAMDFVYDIKVELVFNKDLIPKGADNFTVTFQSKTLSPQFSILHFDNNNSNSNSDSDNNIPTTSVSVSRRQLEGSRFLHSSSIRVHPTYIGHAVVSPRQLEFTSPSGQRVNVPVRDDEPSAEMQLPVTVLKSDKIVVWEVVFVVSVTLLVIISYVNLGAQLDVENLKETIKKPQVLILGFLLTVIIMPAASWLVGLWLLRDQLLYRVGSFIFACCPAASASTLWTVMFNADKEMAISLQAVSTIASVVTMPLLLYFMDRALQFEGSQQTIQVPYGRLIQTQVVLIVALLIGWYFIGRHERAQKIASKVFKPLTFFILFFIIVFSSIVYWYIYAMFDWQITLASLMITLATYGLSSLLGFLVSFNLDRAIAISISSTYKNSGIAFAVLVVAFKAPDTYINYVPCLTQVLTTSITLYLAYSIYTLINYIRRRNQPDPIQATTPVEESGDTTEVKVKRNSRSGSSGSNKSTKEDDNDEFIAMNVTDVVAGYPPEAQPTTGQPTNV